MLPHWKRLNFRSHLVSVSSSRLFDALANSPLGLHLKKQYKIRREKWNWRVTLGPLMLQHFLLYALSWACFFALSRFGSLWDLHGVLLTKQCLLVEERLVAFGFLKLCSQ